MYAVEFSQRANAQMRNLFSYIAEDNPGVALKMVDSLEARANQLANTPFIGVELPKEEYPFLPKGYRKLIISPFIMYYRVINQTVYITHIIHSRRNQAKAFAEE
ncbi:MAG: type II toxin-antitoxin system RelE/ParE family toxin [Defluviitaleaceae bacterium]|nr:type II toxin-antitoxin system RelE/ParE family toxin [Defluviitaleaceae bacterium]